VNTVIITKEAWKQRYARKLVEGGGLDWPTANAAAESAIETADDWNTPEDAAIEEMSYWASEVG
jgi:hypothetical protein